MSLPLMMVSTLRIFLGTFFTAAPARVLPRPVINDPSCCIIYHRPNTGPLPLFFAWPAEELDTPIAAVVADFVKLAWLT
jgi:hypothetical protein